MSSVECRVGQTVSWTQASMSQSGVLCTGKFWFSWSGWDLRFCISNGLSCDTGTTGDTYGTREELKLHTIFLSPEEDPPSADLLSMESFYFL
jgi:hypothetical protein